MTKSLFTFITLVLLMQISFSQEKQTHTASNTNFGIQIGGNLFGIRGDNNFFTNNLDAKIDFLLGVKIERQLKPNLYLKTNLNYERNTLGSVIESLPTQTNPSEDLDIKYTLHTLSIPLFLKRSFGEKEAFYINGGGFVNFLFSETGKLNGESVNFEWGSTFKTINAGAGIGFGTVLFFDDKNSLDIELRNNLGILNISKLNSTVRTNTLSLIATWNFDL